MSFRRPPTAVTLYVGGCPQRRALFGSYPGSLHPTERPRRRRRDSARVVIRFIWCVPASSRRYGAPLATQITDLRRKQRAAAIRPDPRVPGAGGRGAAPGSADKTHLLTPVTRYRGREIIFGRKSYGFCGTRAVCNHALRTVKLTCGAGLRAGHPRLIG